MPDVKHNSRASTPITMVSSHVKKCALIVSSIVAADVVVIAAVRAAA